MFSGVVKLNYLDDDRIVDLITDYMNETTYNYAIMINGEWGSGKTHFVKEVLIPSLKKAKLKRKPIYISLYGLTSVKEVNDKIFTSIIEQYVGKGKKIVPIADVTAKIAAEIVGKVDWANIKTLGTNAFSLFISYDDYYFIFDDLERSSMPTNEMMGYINYFTEQNSTKILLVANEKEIGSNDLLGENYSKYIVAIQEQIAWPEMETPKELGASLARERGILEEQSQKRLNIDELKWRGQLLSEDNVLYKRIKEKLVGQTIYYRPALSKIVPIIMQNFNFNNVEKYISRDDLTEIIIEIMKKEKHFNLRTLQFALAFFQKTLDCLSFCESNEQYYSEALSHILKAILHIAILNTNGKGEFQLSNGAEYGTIFPNGTADYFNSFTSFKFIHEYVYYGVFDATQIVEVFSHYIEDIASKHQSPNDPINILSNILLMEDNEINKQLNALYKNLENDKYKGSSYGFILELLFKLNSLGFEVSIQKYVDYMKRKIHEGESMYTYRSVGTDIQGQHFNDFAQCLQQLRNTESEQNVSEHINKLTEIFEMGAGWGDALSSYYAQPNIGNNYGFFKNIDVNRCFAAIEKSSVKDLRFFLDLITSEYQYTNIRHSHHEDTTSVRKLRNQLLHMKGVQGKMKSHNLKLLDETLADIIFRLSTPINSVGFDSVWNKISDNAGEKFYSVGRKNEFTYSVNNKNTDIVLDASGNSAIIAKEMMSTIYYANISRTEKKTLLNDKHLSPYIYAIMIDERIIELPNSLVDNSII